MSIDIREIAYWPSGEWCDIGSTELYRECVGLSDDCAILRVEWDKTDEEVDSIVLDLIKGNRRRIL